MNYGSLRGTDIANGEGVRVTLFVSGCTHHCKNCFNPETWNFCYGKPFTKEVEDEVIKLLFCNSNIQNGVPIAIILDTGHATRNGGWVAGRDYIHPAIQPIFDKLAKDAWEEVTKL